MTASCTTRQGVYALGIIVPLLLAAGCASPATDNVPAAWEEHRGGTVGSGPSFSHAAVWTGQEVLVWGGTRQSGPCHITDGGVGAALTPGSGRWRAVPPAPLSPREDPHAHWTGTEVLLIGGTVHSLPCTRTPLGDGAAYRPDPAGGPGTWRSLPPPPLPPGAVIAATACTGTELLVWAGLNGAAAYAPDPAGGLGSWRPLPDPPAPPGLVEGLTGGAAQVLAESVWTGGEWLIWATLSSGDSSSYARWSLAYRPAGATWRPIAEGPLAATGLTRVWTGREVLALELADASDAPVRADGPGPATSTVARYEPVRDT